MLKKFLFSFFITIHKKDELMIKFDTQDISFGTIESDITNIFELILPLPNILYFFESWKTECGILVTKPN